MSFLRHLEGFTTTNRKKKKQQHATGSRAWRAPFMNTDACACVCVSVWWAIQQWQWNILILTVESQSLASREEKEKTQVITSTRECGRSTKRHSSWKHYDRWRRKKEKRKGGKTSWVSSVSWICLWETREAEYDSTCRHQNICLKSQQETRERRERDSKGLKKRREKKKKRERQWQKDTEASEHLWV